VNIIVGSSFHMISTH